MALSPPRYQSGLRVPVKQRCRTIHKTVVLHNSSLVKEVATHSDRCSSSHTRCIEAGLPVRHTDHVCHNSHRLNEPAGKSLSLGWAAMSGTKPSKSPAVNNTVNLLPRSC